MPTHLLSPPEVGWIDKQRTSGAVNQDGATGEAAGIIFTSTGAGTTTTMVGAAASLTTSLNCARIGERFALCDSTGKPKESKVFTVTAHNGTTTMTFSPAAAVATANGDKAVLVSGSPYTDNASLDARLLAAGGVYTQKYIDSMTQNDKVYAIRLLENPDSMR